MEPKSHFTREEALDLWVPIWVVVIGIAVALALGGCSLGAGESRKITAWGLWYAGAPGVIGLGYWHSERGDDVKSEESAKPPKVSVP